MIGRVRAAGFATRELIQAYALIDRYARDVQVQVFGYLSSPAVAEELVSIAKDEAPDAVIIDAMFSAALDAAPRFGTPTAVVVHTFLRRMFGAWKANLEMQGAIRIRAGFAPLPAIDELWGSRDLIQVNTLAAFDAPAATPWPNIRHGAPVLDEERHEAATALPWRADDPTPLVLVSFSTVQIQRSPETLQRTLDALAALPVHVVATMGDIVDPAELVPPANAVVLRFASHEELMPRAALVVTHGGHGTAMRSLRYGLPMVCIPALAGDQPFVAAAVEEWGAGRALAREASVAEIRSAAQAALENPSYRAGATRLAPLLADGDGASAAATALEGLIPARAASALNRSGRRG